jgi:hypothetical protein
MSLLNEIAKEGDKRRHRKTDSLKNLLPEKEYKELMVAIKDPTYTVAAITRVLNRRGVKISRFTLDRLRQSILNGYEE